MIKRILAVLALVLVGIVASVAPAQADDSSEFPSCVTYASTGTGAPYGGGAYTGSGDWYSYSPTLVVRGDSACEDIQSRYRNNSGPYPTTLNTWFRIRFYPSSGGSYVNSWKSNNIGVFQNLIIATNVSDGAWFRVETHRRLADGQQVVEPHNFDLTI
jgi:hypothetical protein